MSEFLGFLGTVIGAIVTIIMIFFTSALLISRSLENKWPKN